MRRSGESIPKAPLGDVNRAIHNTGVAKGELTLAAFVALPAVLSALWRHAGQGQLERQVFERPDQVVLMENSHRRLDHHLASQSHAQAASEALEELRGSIGKRVAAQRSDRDA